jgi:hypothetical protein
MSVTVFELRFYERLPPWSRHNTSCFLGDHNATAKIFDGTLSSTSREPHLVVLQFCRMQVI